MKKLLLIALFLCSVSAQATLITDTYTGGNDHGHGDVISSASRVNWFQITGMDVSIAGSTLSVKIFSEFGDAGRGLGSYTSLTNKDLSKIGGVSQGIGFGDLLLSSSGWNPNGSAPYVNDDHSNGTHWDYGISLTNRWSTSSAASLYALNGATNNDNTYLTQDFMSGGTYRNGQEVAVDTTAVDGNNNPYASLVAGNSATFDSTNAGYMLFTADISGTALATASSIGLHWAMTCGNDTIEGEYNVPEPATIMLMMLGLVFMTFLGMRRRQSPEYGDNS